MYLLDLYRDLKIWRTYYKIAKKNEDVLLKNGLRVDMLGRIYTVINVSEDAAQLPNVEMWVLQQLSPYNKVLLDLGIADYSFPEISRIDEPGTNAYLVVMYPELYNINLWKFIIEVAKIITIAYILKILYGVCVNYKIFELISHFYEKHG